MESDIENSFPPEFVKQDNILIFGENGLVPNRIVRWTLGTVGSPGHAQFSSLRIVIQAEFSLLGTAIGCLCYSGQTVTLCPQFCMLWPWQRRRFVSQRTEEPVNAGVKDRPWEYCILVSLHSIPENFEEVRGATQNPGKINKQFV